MEDLLKNIYETIESINLEAEKFMIEVANTIKHFTDEITSGLELDIDAEIELIFQELIEPLLYNESEQPNSSTSDTNPFITFIPPTTNKNPACIGCRHYHGHVYNNNLLVCGMHPYGRTDEHCPDWEKQED